MLPQIPLELPSPAVHSSEGTSATPRVLDAVGARNMAPGKLGLGHAPGSSLGLGLGPQRHMPQFPQHTPQLDPTACANAAAQALLTQLQKQQAASRDSGDESHRQAAVAKANGFAAARFFEARSACDTGGRRLVVPPLLPMPFTSSTVFEPAAGDARPAAGLAGAAACGTADRGQEAGSSGWRADESPSKWDASALSKGSPRSSGSATPLRVSRAFQRLSPTGLTSPHLAEPGCKRRLVPQFSQPPPEPPDPCATSPPAAAASGSAASASPSLSVTSSPCQSPRVSSGSLWTRDREWEHQGRAGEVSARECALPAGEEACSPVWRKYSPRHVGEGYRTPSVSGDSSGGGGPGPAVEGEPRLVLGAAARRRRRRRRYVRSPGPWLRLLWGNRAIPWAETREEGRDSRKVQRAAGAAAAATAAAVQRQEPEQCTHTGGHGVPSCSSAFQVPGRGLVLVGRAIAPSALYQCLRLRGAFASCDQSEEESVSMKAAIGARPGHLCSSSADAHESAVAGTPPSAAASASPNRSCLNSHQAVAAAAAGSHVGRDAGSRYATPRSRRNRGRRKSDCGSGRSGGGIGSTPPRAMTPLSAARVAVAAALLQGAMAEAAAAGAAVASAPTTTLALSRMLGPNSDVESSTNGALSAVGLESRVSVGTSEDGKGSPVASEWSAGKLYNALHRHQHLQSCAAGANRGSRQRQSEREALALALRDARLACGVVGGSWWVDTSAAD